MIREANLVPLGPEIWLVDGAIVDFYGFPYPTRCVIVRLDDGRLWVWSPIALDDALWAQVEALGPVAHLVSPNKIHHLFMGEWKARTPGALLWGLPAVIGKRDDLSFTEPLSTTPPDAWAGQIDQVVFEGSLAMDEITFFHRQSGTAIFADLIENFEDHWLDEHWHGWKSRLAHVWGITEPHGMAPLEFRLSFVRRAPARAALATVLGWNPERVVMAHGKVCADGGRSFVGQCFGWLR